MLRCKYMSTFDDDTALVLHGGEEGEERALLAFLVGSHDERQQGVFGRMCNARKGERERDGQTTPPVGVMMSSLLVCVVRDAGWGGVGKAR